MNNYIFEADAEAHRKRGLWQFLTGTYLAKTTSSILVMAICELRDRHCENSIILGFDPRSGLGPTKAPGRESGVARDTR